MKRCVVFLGWVAVGCLLWACGSSSSDARETSNGGTGGIAGSAGAAGVAGISTPQGGFGGAAGVAATGGFGGMAAAGGTGGIDPNDCGGTVVEPEVIEVEIDVEVTEAEPVAIYIMLDQSGSMITLWPGAVQAITDFVNDPASANLDVALGLFPPVVFGDSCTSAPYNPPPVPLGRLPGHATNVTGGLPAGPIGIGTPIEGALRGATDFCKNFTPADPADAGEECIVLFITDGAPSGCAEDTPTLVNVAQTSGVPIYTIALQGVADLSLLNMIASSTGTDCDPNGANNACDLTTGASFSDALTAIRDTITTVETRIETQVQALTCEWGIPDPDPGKSFNKDEVNVVFTPSPGGVAQTFVNVAGMADCAGNAGAWYYDDAENPTRILACPNTCTALEAADGGSVDIQLGCPILILE